MMLFLQRYMLHYFACHVLRNHLFLLIAGFQVILVRPFMTFTNRLGRDVLIKFNIEDQPKVLYASDTKVSFVHSEAGTEKIQVLIWLPHFFEHAPFLYIIFSLTTKVSKF